MSQFIRQGADLTEVSEISDMALRTDLRRNCVGLGWRARASRHSLRPAGR